MSLDGRAITIKRTKLFTVVPGLFSLVATCSSSVLTCGDADMSKDCPASSDPIEIARPQIVQPQVVRSAPRAPQTDFAVARRQNLSRKSVREARLGRLATGDVTGLPPRDGARLSAPNRRSAFTVEHSAARGETLYSMARRYGTSVAETASFNQSAVIKSDHTIIVPHS